MSEKITVDVVANAPIEKVWEYWTEPAHITRWCFASDDWCAPYAENDVQVGGSFKTRMESTDRKNGFDFNGVYTEVTRPYLLHYTIQGGRTVQIAFEEQDDGCKITETFDSEDENPIQMQKAGWQAILENFKKYTESHV